MKWLRSSLFKNNSDTFVFNEKIDIKMEHYDSSLKGVKNVTVQGVLTRGGKDKIYADLNINGIYEIISARTLNVLEVPFEITEREEFIDKTLVGADAFDLNLMDLYIDLSSLVNELIILNIPITSYSEDEHLETISGNDWEVVSDEELVKMADSPFASLKGMFDK